MAFDPNLDKELSSESVEFEGTRISVKVMSYNDGPPKMQLSRENKRNDEYAFTKLGRLTKEEAGAIIPLMQRGLEHM